jgi:hypothetical protein
MVLHFICGLYKKDTRYIACQAGKETGATWPNEEESLLQLADFE